MQRATTETKPKPKRVQHSDKSQRVSLRLVASFALGHFALRCQRVCCCNCCCCCLTHRCLIVVVSHTFVACRERRGNRAWEREGVQQVLRNRLRFMHFLRHASCVGGFPPPPSTHRGVSLALSLFVLFLVCCSSSMTLQGEVVASNGGNLLH